jgi:hypothetical protein
MHVVKDISTVSLSKDRAVHEQNHIEDRFLPSHGTVDISDEVAEPRYSAKIASASSKMLVFCKSTLVYDIALYVATLKMYKYRRVDECHHGWKRPSTDHRPPS